MAAAATIPGDGDLELFVVKALTRAGLLPLSSTDAGADCAVEVEVDVDAVVAQANAVVIPCRITRSRRPGNRAGTAGSDADDGGVYECERLVVKHVDISRVQYRNDEHRERTRASYVRPYALNPEP
jgi:hypothetical protein